MSDSSKKRTRGDRDVIVLKKSPLGRPKKLLSESNPDASSLFSKVAGIIDGIKTASEGIPVSDDKLIKSISKVISSADKKISKDLHHHVVDQRGDRDDKLQIMKTKIRDLKKEAKFTPSQKAFSVAMKAFDKNQSSQMRKFLVCCLQDLEFLSLTSEKMSPYLEVERLYCMAMDSRNDQLTSILHSLATSQKQESDDDDGEYDVDEIGEVGNKEAGYKSDETTGGYN